MPTLKDAAESIVARVAIGGLAVTSLQGEPLASAVFVVTLGNLRFAFKSRRASEHIQAIARNDRAALILWDSGSSYESKFGVQVKGRVRGLHSLAEAEKIATLYSSKFPGAGKKLPDAAALLDLSTESTFFVFETSFFRVISETPEENMTMTSYAKLAD